MSWAAVVAGGVAITGMTVKYYQDKKDREAERRAMQEEKGMTEAEIAEDMRQFNIEEAEHKRQFDLQYEQQERRYKEGGVRQSQMSESKRAREDLINKQMQERFGTMRAENIKGLDPYITAGQQATTEQQALLGLSGKEAQESALTRMSESPGQQFLRERQERALLRSQAAIGGLGGGNIRTALQEQAFSRAQTDYDRQMQRLGAVSGRGLTAAQERARAEYAPEYISTGADIGVAKTPYVNPNPQAQVDPVAEARAQEEKRVRDAIAMGKNPYRDKIPQQTPTPIVDEERKRARIEQIAMNVDPMYVGPTLLAANKWG